ncbi:MAG: hypothetical protein IPO54_08145 [Micavibrio sp.]|nr:hypothetical protein [Micavibrio sp.]
MQNLARKMTTAMTYPGAFFRYQSKPLRSFYHALSRAAHVQTFLKRCNDNADTYSAKKLTIEDADGFSVFSPSQVPDNLAQDVVAEIRARLQNIDVETIRKTSKKPYLLSVIKGAEISRDSAIYKLVSHREVVGCVARYLKCFPILSFIAVWYSPNLPGQETGSQKFHLDHEDYRQIKAFMFIEDIGPNNGPFTLIPAAASEKIQNAINYKMTPDNKQIEDETVYGIAGSGAARPLTGPPGTLALIDTSRCFHYGSREGSAPRIMLTFQYITPFAFVMPWNWRKGVYLPHLKDKNMSSWERKLLGVEI